VQIDEVPGAGGDTPVLDVTVRDFGCFHAPTNGSDRGRGTTLMRELTSDFERHAGPTGTTIRFRLPVASLDKA
jgi:hypothetical protein